MDRQISIAIVKAELERAVKMGEGLWVIENGKENPEKFFATMINRRDNETYILEFNCEDYKEKPPFIEMIDARNGQRGVPTAYPSGNGFFNNAQYFICSYFNRKAYRGYTTLHTDWQFETWLTNAKGYTTLGDMLAKIYLELQNCTGRLG